MARSWFACVALILALACEGGGGGGNDGGGSSKPLQVTLSANALSFTGLQGQSLPSQTVYATVSGGSGTLYLGASSNLPIQAAVTIDSATHATAKIGPVPGVSLPAGLQSGAITFVLSSDPGGTQVLWTGSIQINLTVYGTVETSHHFSGSQTASAPLTTTLHVTPPDTAMALGAQVLDADWLHVSHPDPATFTVTADLPGHAAGSFAGTVRILGYGATLDLPVTMDVASGILAPTGKVITLEAQTQPSALSDTFPVDFRDGVTPAWTATSDSPWLGLTSASGTGPGSFGFTLDPSLIQGGSPRWTSATATVTLSAAGLSPVVTQVQVLNHLPKVFTTLPPRVTPGTPTTLRVVGRGFSTMGPSPTFSLGSAGTYPATVLSDTQADVSLGALPPGIHSVAPALAVNAQAFSALLRAQPPTVFSSPRTGLSSQARSVVFDPIRNAIYALVPDYGQNRLFRTIYDADAGTWSLSWVDLKNGYNGVGDLGLSPDRRTLYLTSDGVASGVYSSFVQAFDPDTLTLQAAIPVPGPTAISPGPRPTLGAQATQDNLMWFPGRGESGLTFDLCTWAPAAKGIGYTTSATLGYASASGDGNTLLAGAGSVSGLHLSRFITSQDASVDSLDVMTSARMNGDGSRVVVDGEYLRDVTQNYLLLGRVSDGTTTYVADALLSWDGTRAYRPTFSVSFGAWNIYTISSVDVFDTTQTDGQSPVPHFVKIATLPLSAPLTWLNQYGDGSSYHCFLSPEGDVLFLEAEGAIEIIPVPLALRSSAAPLRLRAAEAKARR